MLTKRGFLLLFICIACVLLFVIFMDRILHMPETKLIYQQTIRETTDKLAGKTDLLIEPSCNVTFLAWVVTSYAADPTARSALRRAYTDEELQALGIRRVFLLGRLNSDDERKMHISQNALLDESHRFNDILQGNFLDTYRNLTYKHLMGLQWAMNNCKYVKYIMKMDDDIVVNIYGILEMLQSDTIENNFLSGYILRNMVPVREPTNKWFVSKAEYAGSIYPDFLSGWLYITSLYTVNQLVNYAISLNTYFWIDDVFITGIIRQALNIKIQNISDLYTTDHRYLYCCIKGKKSLLKCELLVGPNGGDTELQVRFKEFAKFCHTSCSVRTKNNLVSKTCVATYQEPKLHRGAVEINPIRIL